MNFFSKFVFPVAAAVLVVAAYMQFGWSGVAGALGLVVMWLLLHFNRMMQVMKRAANRPLGYVDSAVMLNAKLRPGVPLLHVVAMTKSLGLLQSVKGAQPELFRWTDGSDSHVTCEFGNGKLVRWKLERPLQVDTVAVPDAAAAPSTHPSPAA